jgi:peroxiredoxin
MNSYLNTAKIFLAFLIIILLNISTAMAQKIFRAAKDASGLQVGQEILNFSAKDMNGNIFILSEILKVKPLVIIFYRGHWCPICNKHLNNLQDSLNLIYDKGAAVVAISPDRSEFLVKTAKKTSAEFTLLHDEGYKISDLFDLTFKPDSLTRIMYNTVLGAKLKEAHSDDSEQLPIPATYIIDKNFRVVWRHFDPNYKNRASIKDIIDNIPENE